MRYLLIIASVVGLSACATKNYPMAMPISEAKAMSMQCTQLSLELADIDALELKIQKEAGFDIRSAGAIWMDLGIGNSIAKGNAKKALAERKVVLSQAYASKECAAV